MNTGHDQHIRFRKDGTIDTMYLERYAATLRNEAMRAAVRSASQKIMAGVRAIRAMFADHRTVRG